MKENNIKKTCVVEQDTLDRVIITALYQKAVLNGRAQIIELSKESIINKLNDFRDFCINIPESDEIAEEVDSTLEEITDNLESVFALAIGTMNESSADLSDANDLIKEVLKNERE